MAEIVRYYIMSEIWETVTQSQVFGWLELLNKNGYPASCISLVDIKTLFKKNMHPDVEVSDQIGGKFYLIPILKKIFLIDIQIFFILFFIWLKEIIRAKKIIFQTRLQYIAYPLYYIRLFPKVKIIYDARAALLEEFYYNLEKKKLSFHDKINHHFLKCHEKMMLRKADKIFCVSKKLKEYYLSKYKNISESKFSVIPGAADSNLFYFDKSLREKVRDRLGLSGKIVIVYSGRLAVKWHVPRKIFELYKFLSESIDNIILLLVTPDMEVVNLERVNFSFSEKQVLSFKSRYKNVCSYLNAADYGLLLRDNQPMNQVASPTKFAEYVLCGLPTIISNGVGDFSNLVKRKQFGFVINHINDIQREVSMLSKYIMSIEADQDAKMLLHSKIAKWGFENFSKKVYLSKIVRTLKSI